MAFITEKEELKPGLVLFRRGDVEHRMWYCRMKMPKADRYKTVSLKTTDISAARERAFDQDADIRFRIKHDVPVFNRPFREVAREYLLTQEARAKRGEISAARPKKLRAVIEGTLDRYAGSTQVHLIGDERWGSYPAWRRENGAGRHKRNGVRDITADVAQSFADHESARRTKVQQTLGIRVLKPIAVKPQDVHAVRQCPRAGDDRQIRCGYLRARYRAACGRLRCPAAPHPCGDLQLHRTRQRTNPRFTAAGTIRVPARRHQRLPFRAGDAIAGVGLRAGARQAWAAGDQRLYERVSGGQQPAPGADQRPSPRARVGWSGSRAGGRTPDAG
jgi:hypothetical protein